MKSRSPVASLFVVALSAFAISAQAPERGDATRPRAVAQEQKPSSPQKPDDVDLNEKDSVDKKSAPALPANTPSPIVESPKAPSSASVLAPSVIRSRLTEAKRLFRSRPLPTAMTSPSIEFVTLAALEPRTSRIHLLTLSKQSFLTKDTELSLTSSLGTPVVLRILRANGVNTAVTVFDSSGRSFMPLVVEFPIEKRGVFREMAYYTSAHPALLSKDLFYSGQAYVRAMLDLAAKRLRDKGVAVSPDLVDIAERLCVVEHVDHFRFRLENRLALFDEIYALYGLNEVDTYRYSVSSAGAGGMVQMIPWAYNLMRQRYPGVGLMPDFVAGMQNHANALQAMLLYMRDTWYTLAANDEVKAALETRIATPAELMAAGYNSNAARLPPYLRRGGEAWRTLIPRETQTYLQIYKTFEALVPLKPRPALVAEPEN